MRYYDICDLHGHFLPGMDDGSRSVEESLRMLEMSMEQGISRMFATPHYYSTEPVAAFLARRQESMDRLAAGMESSDDAMPEICLGAEVAYRQGIGDAEDLEKLCLGKSRYLLLEMPFVPWERSMFRDIGNMANVRGLTPIIAHIERYLPMQKRDAVARLLEQDVLIQMNAEALLNWRTRGKAIKMLQNRTVHLLGSDCHNLGTRAPNMGLGLEYMKKRRMHEIVSQIALLSQDIFCRAMRTQ